MMAPHTPIETRLALWSPRITQILWMHTDFLESIPSLKHSNLQFSDLYNRVLKDFAKAIIVRLSDLAAPCPPKPNNIHEVGVFDEEVANAISVPVVP